MQRNKAIISLCIIFSVNIVNYTFANNRISNPLELRDGIDKRILFAKHYLGKVLSKKELGYLSFAEAVAHVKDSSVFYVKVPYKDKQKPGFYLIKNNNNKWQYVQVAISGYTYKDTVMLYNEKTIIISSKDKKLNKKFTTGLRGLTKKMYYPGSRGELDTIFRVIPFIMYAANQYKQTTYIDMNFVFDNIDSLNQDARTKGVIVHDMIILGFKPEPAFELEFNNSNVLPAIDLKEAFKRFDSKPDSIKN